MPPARGAAAPDTDLACVFIIGLDQQQSSLKFGLRQMSFTLSQSLSADSPARFDDTVLAAALRIALEDVTTVRPVALDEPRFISAMWLFIRKPSLSQFPVLLLTVFEVLCSLSLVPFKGLN